MPRHWAVQTILSAGAPPEAVFDVLEGLFQSKVEPWQSRTALVFLLGDALALLRAWLAAYTSAGSTGAKKRASMFGGAAAGFAYEDATTSLLVSTLLQQQQQGGGRLASWAMQSSSSSSFPAKRIDDALTAYLVSLNSLLSGGGGAAGIEGEARETVSGMKVLQDNLRRCF